MHGVLLLLPLGFLKIPMHLGILKAMMRRSIKRNSRVRLSSRSKPVRIVSTQAIPGNIRKSSHLPVHPLRIYRILDTDHMAPR